MGASLAVALVGGAIGGPALAAPAAAEPDATAADSPLAPLDTSSPRATLASFRATFDRIYANLVAEEKTPALWAANRRLIRQALNCLDISALPASLADSEGRQALVCLK
ncbi:MAG: hypothetical protein ACKOHK_01905, partial [Planctomycetia bacterium]